MSICLCCGKSIENNASEQEKKTLWHENCCKKFFGTRVFPNIDISKEILESIVEENTFKGYTVPGVQKKLSLHLSKASRGEQPRLTIVNYPTGYILKPQTEDYKALPEAEYLVMNMAKVVGINIVPFALIQQGDSLAYITKRIDRISAGRKDNIKMLAMEDFCQLDGRLTQDKYKGSYERCAKIINQYSVQRGLDMTELFYRIVFSYLIGNSDMHLKNFSLIETSENSQKYILSAAYDMLPVNIILPADRDQFAITLNGKKRNVTRNDFLKFADNCQIDRKVANNIISKILSKKEQLIELCRTSFMPDEMKIQLEELMLSRANTFNINP